MSIDLKAIDAAFVFWFIVEFSIVGDHEYLAFLFFEQFL